MGRCQGVKGLVLRREAPRGRLWALECPWCMSRAQGGEFINRNVDSLTMPGPEVL